MTGPEALPEWARWRSGADAEPWTVGVEEEIMLVEPGTGRLAQAADVVVPALSERLAASTSVETHAAALELATTVHQRAGAAVDELAGLRAALADELRPHGVLAAAAGMHPTAEWRRQRVTEGDRQAVVHATMRELARREPTFALHVHIGVGDPETATDVVNRLRVHLPLLLALSANSPFWQGRDSGLASARTHVFQGFPRVGLPRRFGSYGDWVSAVAPLIDSGAIPEPTFLWWDVRLQPRFGTVEVRIMDAQTTLDDLAGLVALVQALARLEATEGYAPAALIEAEEVLHENRFLAARDGMEASFVVPGSRRRMPARAALAEVLAAARPHAERLGSLAGLDLVARLAGDPPADRQRAAAQDGLGSLVQTLCDGFAPAVTPAGA